MLRTTPSIEAGTGYHVLNRGDGCMRLFHKDGDYEAFEPVLTEGLSRYLVDRLGLEFTLRNPGRPWKTQNNQ